MTDFEDFYRDLTVLAKKYGDRGIPLKIEKDLEHDIIKVFGEKITSLSRAQNGLDDVTELAYTVAEHHPFWNLVYNCSEITRTALERWTDSLSKDDLSDIQWAVRELDHTLEKIKDKRPTGS